MLDIKWIRNNIEKFKQKMQFRSIDVDLNKILDLDRKARNIEVRLNELLHKKNKIDDSIKNLKDKGGLEFQNLKKEVVAINKDITLLEKDTSKKSLDLILSSLPNLTDDEVPVGDSEKDNVEIRRWGQVNITNAKVDHTYLGEKLGMLDFAVTAKMSGSRYVSLASGLARLERALINFMLDFLKGKDFVEISCPSIVKEKAMYNVGQLPKFSAESFSTNKGDRLIPTGEVTLTNLVANKIIPREMLPLKFASFSPCFRSEAGSAGKDTKGMIRLHQFYKVEMVVVSVPDESEEMHQSITNNAEMILQKLNLPYRVVELCTGDLGYAAQKTYDLEVWIPSENTYREISSCSNCGDYQARRMKTRFKNFGSKDNILVHTLNGSGLAVGRTLLAVMENYQNSDGTIRIPEVLIDYMGGEKLIKPFDKIDRFFAI